MDDLAMSVNSIAMSDECFNTKNELSSNISCNYSTLNIASNTHPRLDVYKKRINTFKSNQEERRRHILLEQKK